MSVALIKCKICNKVISEPERIVGEPEGTHHARFIQKMMKHMESRINEEMNNQLLANKPHAAVWQQSAISIFTYQMLMTSYLFTLSPELEKVQETQRAGFHASTRKQLKITDEELEAMQQTFINGNASPLMLMQDLRDRYEEIGEYAPAAPQNGQPKPA